MAGGVRVLNPELHDHAAARLVKPAWSNPPGQTRPVKPKHPPTGDVNVGDVALSWDLQQGAAPRSVDRAVAGGSTPRLACTGGSLVMTSTPSNGLHARVAQALLQPTLYLS